MPLWSTFIILLSVSSLLSVACQKNEGSASACVSLGESGGEILVDILCSGVPAQPIYNWDSEKPVDSLSVFRVMNNELVWEIEKIGTEPTITSPVKHGELPVLALLRNEEELDLTVDVEYRVELFVVDPLAPPFESGSLTFTPLSEKSSE